MLFSFEERLSDSPFVQSIWCAQSERSGSFISTAAIHWEISLVKYKGKTTLGIHGPETKATFTSAPEDAEWLGISFKLGTFMPHLLPSHALDKRDVSLPEAGGKSFWLGGSSWAFPTYDNADTFVKRLIHRGLLVRDQLVEDLMQDTPINLSPRAVQYRFQRATGLSYRTVRQIQRAQKAATLIEQGRSIVDTAYQLGYYDQAHLANSIRRYLGRTPTQISRTLQPE